MRYSLSLAGTALLAVVANADLCGQGSSLIGGNYYCQAVDTIQYTNFGASGSYNRVTSMDSTSGTCSSEPFSYSGGLAPMDGEISMHFRGPLALKQFAFYTPGTGSSKPKRSVHHHNKRHGHAHFHAHDKQIREIQQEAEKRAVGDWVIATMDGKVVSWQNQYAGGAAPAAPTPAAAPAGTGSFSGSSSGKAGAAVNSAPAASTAAAFVPSYNGDWVQAAYYNSETQTAKGLTFLNNNGGSGSGVFDYKFGNSLSYASSSGTDGAAAPQVLADITLPSNKEIIIMSDQACTGSSCGFYRPGTVAYHGFAGANKVFLAEFSMPDDGTSGWNMNMPAWWSLNAQIPRTLQYGDASCSCWKSGCGEFDIMEVLDSGNTRTKSTLHAGSQSAGDSDYIDRPTGAPIKVAFVMSGNMATIQVLNPDFDFSKTLTNAQVEGLGQHTTGGVLEDLVTLGSSVFNLS